jgi:hypothetical protein
MKQYLTLIQDILNEGESRDDRTGTGTISKFGTQSRYDLRTGFPLVTTKKVFFRGIVHEMLWFIKGDTNIKYLVDNKVNIWNEWPYEIFKKSPDFNGETLPEFIERIKTDDAFANRYGELGPVYGKQYPDTFLINDVPSFLANWDEKQELVVIGGLHLYNSTISAANRLVISIIKEEYIGDTVMCDIPFQNFKEISSEEFAEFKVITYERI